MLPLVAFFLAQSVGARVILPAASCDKLPSWSIKDFKVEFGACQGQNLPTARAYFTVSGTLSGGRSDGLSCSMRANSHCQIDGTPSDTNCHIYIQTYLDEYIVTINETMSCEGNPAVSYVVGQGRLPLDCPADADNDPGATKTCVGDSGTVQAMLPGSE